MSRSGWTSKPRPVIVLGVERSGTSVVAGMVNRCGAYAGEAEKLRKADERNPRGYWEYAPIWNFLEGLGDLADGVSWWDPSFQDLVRERARIPQYKDKAFALTAAMEEKGKAWFWKDPALIFYLPFWKEIWGDAAYVITARNPCDTARSWQEFVLPSDAEGR